MTHRNLGVVTDLPPTEGAPPVTTEAPPRPASPTRPDREVARMRSFRSVDSVWHPAKAAAEGRGDNLSDVLNAALRRYIARARREAADPPPDTNG